MRELLLVAHAVDDFHGGQTAEVTHRTALVNLGTEGVKVDAVDVIRVI